MQQIVSSSVREVGYDRERRRLLVRFRSSGRVYAYLNVGPEIFAAFERAPSKGRFINYRIKGRYRYERLRRA